LGRGRWGYCDSIRSAKDDNVEILASADRQRKDLLDEIISRDEETEADSNDEAYVRPRVQNTGPDAGHPRHTP
jgi:hypothetical protein